MPWTKTPADRARDAKTYDNPEYRRNRPLAMKRDRWRCQLRYRAECTCSNPDCRRFHGCISAARECDHIVQPRDGGGHGLANLRAACKPCHGKRTAQQSNTGTGSRADPQPQPRTAW